MALLAWYSTILIQYRRVTDGRTDRRTDGRIDGHRTTANTALAYRRAVKMSISFRAGYAVNLILCFLVVHTVVSWSFVLSTVAVCWCVADNETDKSGVVLTTTQQPYVSTVNLTCQFYRPITNKLEAIQRWSAICRVWPWTLTYQKFLLCISSQGQDLYSHQKLNMYIYWFSSESGYRRRRRRRRQRRTPQYNH